MAKTVKDDGETDYNKIHDLACRDVWPEGVEPWREEPKMNKGSIWIRKELAEATVIIARAQAGVSQAEIVDERNRTMSLVEYCYPIKAMKMFIAHELHRKIELLRGSPK